VPHPLHFTMSDEYSEKKPVDDHAPQVLPTGEEHDLEGHHELHRGLKNRHAQMIA